MNRIIHALAAVAAILSCAGAPSALAQAPAYPDRPIKLIVGGPPGASSDLITRLVGERFGKALGQPVVVENRPGAGGVVAVRSLVAAKPDGYTLLVLYTDNVIVAPFLSRVPPYDPLKDLVYVGAMARSNSFILAVHPAVPAQSFDEFIRLAKSAPKRISYSTYGLGSIPQLGFETMATQAGAEMVHVPFKGGAESYQAAVAGNVDAVAGTSFTELLKSGRLRPLAIGGNKRSTAFPGIPTFAELGYGEQIFGPVYFALAAPAGTPKDIVERLAAELKKFAEMPDLAERIAPVATEPYWASGEDFAELVRKGIDLYVPLIRRLGLSTQ